MTSQDIAETDRALLEAFPEKKRMVRWLDMAARKVAHMGLPARICWLGYGERDRAGKIFNDLVASGRVSAPPGDRPRSPGLRGTTLP